MYLRVFLLVMVISLPIDSFAKADIYEDCSYETGDRISISVLGQMSKDAATGIFFYTYTLKSHPQSEQNVWRFKIILPEKNIIADAGSAIWGEPGWSGKPTKYSSRREIIPPYRISWTAPEEAELKPSETLTGFFYTSFGLPGIADYYAEGDAPLPKCPEGMAVDFIPGYDDLTPYGPGIVGKTIGPTAPPADLKPIEFIDNIISQKHEASKLGWIKNAGVENSLDAKLDNAKKSLQGGNIQSAKNILQAFINEVEAQGCKTYEDCPQGKQLTSEAYALLKYNMQYLIDNLK